MPTVIVLDVSLSMSRPVVIPDCSEEYQRKHLAIHGINCFLDYLSSNFKLEFTSLLVFSFLWEQLVPFTRNYETIKSALNSVEEYNKTCIEAGLTGASSVVTEEWNSVTPSQVILVTDGRTGIGQRSLKNSLETWNQRENGDEKFPLPFKFPCKLHIMIISSPNDPDIKSSLPLFEKLIEINGQGGELCVPDNTLTLQSVEAMFTRIQEKFYQPYNGTLKCGNFKCSVQLFPPPDPYDLIQEFEEVHQQVSSNLEILGFIDIADIASPQALSRHLVLPLPNKDTKTSDSEVENKKEEEDAVQEEGKIPSFTVLLHGSLKVEGMVALTQVAENWYGILYSWADSKKKSNLMLSLLEPGPEPISWIGNIANLAPISDFTEPPYGEDDNKTPFPIRPAEKHSYAQSCVVWIKPSGLQADIQKVLRHARKLPEKHQQFYKELNRLRRAALSFGFLDLLEAMASMLDRECTMLPGSAHPDAALQLTHAANALRSESATDIAQMILPLRTNFNQDTS
ncbi:integrator complex subunit 14-like [Saccostrea echinata]|uniref:integrator complex subunit 14-like n=1 Tax=Saccostrea echinata TaxID=191078 RepID=UPI002A80F68F|nr:integrator complex subunit 14-like [Saccostrea echinata]